MGLLGTLLRTAIHVVTVPVDVALDLVTMGGVLTDEGEPYTVQKAKKLKTDMGDIEDDVDRL
jgi:hypothetical protein